jgi:hypothetical protein
MVRDNYLSEFQKYQKWIEENNRRQQARKLGRLESPSIVDEDEPVDLYEIYKGSSRRLKRTNYNLSFSHVNTFLPSISDESMRETRAVNRRWFNESCFNFDPNGRMNALAKPAHKRPSLDERVREQRRSEDYGKYKEASSIQMLDELNQRTSSLIKSFRNNCF